MGSLSKEAREHKKKVDALTQRLRDDAFRERERGNYDKALEKFEEVLSIDLGDEEAWYGKGEVYEKARRKNMEEDCFKKALRLAEIKENKLIISEAQEGLARLRKL